jgi:PAS domain S-box-containing protein
MTWQYLPYVATLAGASLASALIAVYAWRRRSMPGGTYFSLLMVAVAVWSLANAVEYATLAIPLKVLWTKVSYLGIVSVGPLWLLFALGYARRSDWLVPWRVALIWIVPVATLLLAATNDWHYLYWPTITPISDEPGAALAYGHGIIVWLWVAYSYVLLLIGAVLLVRTTLRAPLLYRRQIGVLLAGMVLPWLGNVLYMLGLSPFPGLDVAPIAFTLSGALVAWAILRLHVLDIVPVARDIVIESMSDGVLVLDARGRVADLNPAACRLIGRAEKDVVGQPAAVVLARWPELVERYRDATSAWDEIAIAHPSPQWLDLRISPLHDRHGNLTGRVVMLRDITAAKKAQQALQQYAQELESRNAELDSFAHTVAHDLKNPLAALLGFGALLGSAGADIAPERRERALGMIVQSGKKMASIIDELLLLASVRKMEQVPLAALDMGAILVETRQRLAPLVSEYGAEISAPAAWPAVLGYAPWVEQVWVNYLSNAIQYGGRPPRIALGYDPPAAAGSLVRFWIRDNGAGLPPEAQERLFVEFSRLDQVGTKGHGLGLSIVQRIVKRLGGQVGVESQAGQGSTFFFTLPPAA